MTRQELEERLLDYLYDELEPSERAAFERALPQHPEVAREVAAHQATRKAYQALPRESAPAGLLDEVLQAADAEAARRARAAAGEGRVGLLERVRRLLFQPAFAMAMVVLVVAGVSLIGTKKGELPGMPAATDSQSLPAGGAATVKPVSVDEAAGKIARDRAEAPAAAVAQAADEPKAADQAFAPAEPAARALADETAKEKRDEASLATGEGAFRFTKPESAQAKPTETGRQGPASGAKLDMNGERAELETAAPGLLAKGGAAGGDLAEDALHDAGAPAKSPEPSRDAAPTAPEEKLAGGRTADEEPGPPPRVPVVTGTPQDVSNDRGDTTPKTPAPRPANAKPPATAPAEADKAATKDVPPAPDANRGDTEQGNERAKETPAREVIVTETKKQTEAPGIDDDKRKEEQKPAPNLMPPAPSADKLWSTYAQQMAAGAWVDAERSITALAKLEGETARVKQARAELKKRIEATKQSGGAAERIPPDPPVQPPK